VSPSRVESIMENLRVTLQAIPEVRKVVLEAPRESETIKPALLPHVWCWENPLPAPTNAGTDLLECALPVSIEVVYDDKNGLRTEGRKWVARIQAALAKDIGRGRDEGVSAALAIDTADQGSVIAPMPAQGFGCAHLEYLITYNRHFKNPYGLTPPVAA